MVTNVLVSLCREWYLNGNYLIVIVSVGVILPLALMKQLGEYVKSNSSYSGILVSLGLGRV